MTRSGRMYNRMERDKEREVITLSNMVRKGSEDILRKMDRHDMSNEDTKRIVREGLLALSDTVEREMTGISEKMSEAVRRVVEVEVAEMKDRIERLEERARTREDMVSDMARKVEERTKESVENETMMSHKLERAEDRIKETEEELKNMEQKRITERLEKVEERLEDSEEEKRQDDREHRLEKLEEKIVDTENILASIRHDKEIRGVDTEKQKDLEDRLKLNEEMMDKLRKDGDSTRRKESEREMRERIEARSGAGCECQSLKKKLSCEILSIIQPF